MRRSIAFTALMFFGAAWFLTARAAPALVFPGAEWAESSPESQGIDGAKLRAAIEDLDARLGDFGGFRAAVIIRNGYLIWRGPECDAEHQVFSATKSFTSTCLGLLIDDGKVKLDTPAKDLVPDLAELYPGATLRHFATMTSGYDAPGGAYEPDSKGRLDGSGTPLAPAAPLFPPGSKFRYWDDAMMEFGHAMTRAAGEPLDRLFRRRIAEPIGMNRWKWVSYGGDERILWWAGGIVTSAPELARLGHLFLGRGLWDGRRLLSPSWVEQAASVQVPADLPDDDLPRSRGSGVYGFNWWVNGLRPDGKRFWPGAPPRTFAALGLHDNVCFVVPEWNLVMARTNGGRKDGRPSSPGNIREIWSAFFEKLGAAIRNEGTSAAPGPLRVHPTNPRYFTDGSGRAVYLTGSHVWNSLQDVTGEWFVPNLISRQGYGAYLEFMAAGNQNFMRMWTIDQVSGETENTRISPHPWMRIGPGAALDGLPKFDLERPYPVFYERLRTRVLAARDRGIYVSVMLFGGMWGTEHRSTWKGHPFNAGNNINGIDGDPNQDGLGNEIYTLEIPAVTAIQKAHARKVIDATNDLENVLYEIANEVREYSTPWQYEMVKAVKEYEASKPRQHPVGMTGYDTIPDSDLMKGPADWISPSNSGGNYKSDPPAATGAKVILIDTDHLWGEGGDPGWVWRSFTRGLQPIWMERLKMGAGDLPGAEAIRSAMGQARSLAQRLDLAALAPRPDLSSTGYCLARPGREYLIYQPRAGEVFSVELEAGTCRSEWLQPAKDSITPSDAFNVAAGLRRFRAPFDGEAVLHLNLFDPSRKGL